MKVTIEQFLVDVKANGHEISFVVPGNTTAFAQHLYDVDVIDNYIKMSVKLQMLF